jgi:hypothetical protein
MAKFIELYDPVYETRVLVNFDLVETIEQTSENGAHSLLHFSRETRSVRESMDEIKAMLALP